MLLINRVGAQQGKRSAVQTRAARQVIGAAPTCAPCQQSAVDQQMVCSTALEARAHCRTRAVDQMVCSTALEARGHCQTRASDCQTRAVDQHVRYAAQL